MGCRLHFVAGRRPGSVASG